MEASEPKLVNSILNIIGVNSLRPEASKYIDVISFNVLKIGNNICCLKPQNIHMFNIDLNPLKVFFYKLL